MNMEKFKPTQEMITLAKSALQAEIHTASIKSIVTAYQIKILAKYQFKYSREEEMGDQIILDPNHSYRMSDEDFAIFDKECKMERDNAGLLVADNDFCPLLVAENAERIAKRALVDSMKPITKMDSDMVLSTGLKNYEKLVNLTLKYFTGYFKEHNIKL